TREIREAGLAGGLVFAWLDEWFKHTWVTIDLELPAERTRLWHNVMDAEQNYGLLGEYAGAGDATPEPGGEAARWRALPLLGRDRRGRLRGRCVGFAVRCHESLAYCARRADLCGPRREPRAAALRPGRGVEPGRLVRGSRRGARRGAARLGLAERDRSLVAS